MKQNIKYINVCVCVCMCVDVCVCLEIKEGREEEYLEDCGIKRGHGPSAFHSALDRAKTHQCKAEIAVVGCSLTKAQLYPAPLLKPLPNYCHFDERERTGQSILINTPHPPTQTSHSRCEARRRKT